MSSLNADASRLWTSNSLSPHKETISRLLQGAESSQQFGRIAPLGNMQANVPLWVLEYSCSERESLQKRSIRKTTMNNLAATIKVVQRIPALAAISNPHLIKFTLHLIHSFGYLAKHLVTRNKPFSFVDKPLGKAKQSANAKQFSPRAGDRFGVLLQRPNTVQLGKWHRCCCKNAQFSSLERSYLEKPC